MDIHCGATLLSTSGSLTRLDGQHLGAGGVRL